MKLKFIYSYYPERVMRFGPDLACLEWLMKCGSTQIIMSDETKITSQKEMQNYFKNLGIDIKKKIVKKIFTKFYLNVYYWVFRKHLRRK